MQGTLTSQQETQELRSIEHACKCKKREHPSKNRSSCVALNMCSCATNVITSHPTSTPRVAYHQPCVQVQRCHYTRTPTPTQRGNLCDRRAGSRTFGSVYIGLSNLRANPNPRGNLRDRRAGKRTFCSVYSGRNTVAREPKTKEPRTSKNIKILVTAMLHLPL